MWVHENCARFSPEVGEDDGLWFNVMSAVKRGRKIVCESCDQKGATIGCCSPDCDKSFHFLCAAVETEWDFALMGKAYMCTKHRTD